MKKTLLATSLAAAMGIATTADAAFTAMGPGDYSMSVTGGCFEFGNCQTSGGGAFTDNTAGQATFTTTANTVTTRPVGSTVGSGTVGGSNGTINFSLDAAGDMTITSFAQDSYLATAGGTFYVDALGTSGTTNMTGTVNGAGDVLFTPTGREGLAASFATSLGTQPWNDSKKIGMYDSFSTGTTTNEAKGGSPAFSVTGTALQDTGVNAWAGVLATTGNINGDFWVGFNNVQYSEIFNVSIALVKGLPTAVDDDLSTPLATQLDINIDNDLIAPNDTHSDATETLSYVSFDDTCTDPVSSVSEAGGIITYIPNPAFTDPSVDCITYTITDSGGVETSTATINITVTGSLPPIANPDAVDAIEDTLLPLDPVHNTLAVPGVVLDSDPVPAEIPGLTITAFDPFSANGGTITQAPGTNELTYTPAADYFGPDSFGYTIQNSVPLSDSTTVTVTVAAVNDAPVCADVGLTTPVDMPLDIDVANDLLSTTSTPPLCTDAEGDTVSLASIDGTGSNGGTMADDGAGTLTYTPAAGFIGAETFSYTATDGADDAAPNTLTITVADPIASNFTMLEKAGNVFGGTNDVAFEWDEVTVNTNDLDGNGVPTDVNFGIMTIASDNPFFGFVWTAHHIRVFRNTTAAPIEYNFDVTCLASDYDSGVVSCNRPLADQGAATQYLTLTLQPGEIGGHILFDWNTSKDIDVINIWKENEPWNTYGATAPTNSLWLGEAGIPPAPDTDWRLVSFDVPGDGVDNINGSRMIDGPFKGFFANFNYKPFSGGTALPPYDGQISSTKASLSMDLWSLLAGVLAVFGLRRFKNKM